MFYLPVRDFLNGICCASSLIIILSCSLVFAILVRPPLVNTLNKYVCYIYIFNYIYNDSYITE